MPGGNSDTAFVDVRPGSLTDITGGNRITTLTSKALTESPDVLRPTLGSAIIDCHCKLQRAAFRDCL